MKLRLRLLLVKRSKMIRKSRYGVVASLCAVLIVSCSSANNINGSNRINVVSEVFFTNIGNSRKIARSPQVGLVELINRSQRTIHCAFYEISSKGVVNALIDAKRRGVKVAIVLEEDNLYKGSCSKLVSAGIGVVVDGRNPFMHNKFLISDGRYLWTGSYNPSYNGNFHNNNNAVLVDSQRVSDRYEQEFNEMYVEKIFGNRYEVGPFALPRKLLRDRGRKEKIRSYFSPEDGVEDIILGELHKAKKTVEVMAFSFTSKRIADELIALNKSGVDVRVVVESRGSKGRYSQFARLKINCINMRLDGNRYLMHHKVIVIDGTKVITGSYNFSKNANIYNDENILIINNPLIASLFLKEFRKNFNK